MNIRTPIPNSFLLVARKPLPEVFSEEAYNIRSLQSLVKRTCLAFIAATRTASTTCSVVSPQVVLRTACHAETATANQHVEQSANLCQNYAQSPADVEAGAKNSLEN